MTWVLVIFFHVQGLGGSTDFRVVEGFSSKMKCMEAAKTIKSSISEYSRRRLAMSCVQK